MPKVEANVQETDVEWEKWGDRDPYFGVLTHARYRASTITADDYLAFFESGRGHVEAVLASCKRHFDEDFRPRRVLDFGCGVGRVLLPFAESCETVVGVDVSESMLAEARRNCARFGVANVTLVRADDTLSAVEGHFDLVHSTIVFQRIESERGLDLIARLVELVAPGGGVSIHVTYGRDYGECRYGRPVPESIEPPDPAADPVMMMYHYDLSRIAYPARPRSGMKPSCGYPRRPTRSRRCRHGWKRLPVTPSAYSGCSRPDGACGPATASGGRRRCLASSRIRPGFALRSSRTGRRTVRWIDRTHHPDDLPGTMASLPIFAIREYRI